MAVIALPKVRHLAIMFIAGAVLVLAWGNGCSRLQTRQASAQPAAVPAPARSMDEGAGGAAVFRLARDSELSRGQEMMEQLLQGSSTTQEMRSEVQRALWQLAKVAASEREAETLLALEGWSEAAVAILGSEVLVVISRPLRNEAEAAKIAGLVAGATGRAAETIKIHESQGVSLETQDNGPG